MSSPATLPRSGARRALLQSKGQFWTPAWVARAMGAYVLADHAPLVFDPAVGAGALLIGAQDEARSQGRHVQFAGTELDPGALDQARAAGLSKDDLAAVRLQDFIAAPTRLPHGVGYPAITANPPYCRHSLISAAGKAWWRAETAQRIGKALDARAGLHVYFLVKALGLLAPGGRLAFIMPADTAEGVFASELWAWITRTYCLEAVVTFDPAATPFPGVDTNAVIFCIRHARPTPTLAWARVHEAESAALTPWLRAGGASAPADASMTAIRRSLEEAITTGLSRLPQAVVADGPTLGAYARVVRGIVTGANEFFFLTTRQADALRIPAAQRRRAIGRTRDLDGDLLTAATLEALDHAGRPTVLFAPDGRALEDLPPAVAHYLRQGAASGIADRAIMRARRPWYRMEQRTVPPFLFAYLGRRSARFIRNTADVVPLTGFLCVYPHDTSPEGIAALWQVLQHPATVANLARVGKSYGGGAIKVEPRALERLPLPLEVLAAAGLTPPASADHPIAR